MTVSPKPRIRPLRSRAEWALELASALAVSASVGIVARAWSALPERVPRHFAATGTPDAYGSRSNMLIPALLAAGFYLAMTIVQLVPPWRYNYPVQITAENAPMQYGIARLMISTIKAGAGVLIACVTWWSVQVALGQRQGLPVWLLPTVLAFPVLLIFLVTYLSRRQRT